jgi:phage shock protein PspC (stress-responsive transcriptional regulator)
MVRERPRRDHGRMETQARTSPTEPPRIKRARDDRVLGGVCSGIARYFDIDPVLVRVATVALVCAVGVGAVAYVAAWILMPLDDRPAATATSVSQSPAPA